MKPSQKLEMDRSLPRLPKYAEKVLQIQATSSSASESSVTSDTLLHHDNGYEAKSSRTYAFFEKGLVYQRTQRSTVHPARTAP